MSPNPAQKSSTGKKSALELKESTSVITVRIDNELNNVIKKLRSNLGISKADFIRNYLEMSKYVIIQNNAIKSLNNRDLIVIKKSFVRKLIEVMDEKEQIELGVKTARFINDIATLQGKINDIEYKLDLCEHLGFFPKLIDEENFILFPKKFGPKKFIEAFVYKLVNYELKDEFDLRFTEENMKGQSKIESAYKKALQPEERLSSHYSFGIAKLGEEEG